MIRTARTNGTSFSNPDIVLLASLVSQESLGGLLVLERVSSLKKIYKRVSSRDRNGNYRDKYPTSQA